MKVKLFRSVALQSVAARIVVLACAASAGAHAGLVPEHLRSEPRMGFAFLVAVVLLLATALAVALRPSDHRIACTAVLLFIGLIAAYTASCTTGIPVIGPDPEAVDAVGVATNAVEALGLACALLLTNNFAADGGGSLRRSKHEQLLLHRAPLHALAGGTDRAREHGRGSGGVRR